MPSDAAPVPQSLTELDALLSSFVDPVWSPGLAWGILHKGQIHTGASGLAERSKRVRATAQIPFAMASVTKPMTTTAIALLASRGQIDLDKPINDYLGDAKIQSQATVRNVANHTAGLPLHYQFYYEDEPYARPPFDETICRYAKTFSPVGARHHYSNLGYGLLDYIIERVSGKPYADFMAEEIFTPLGMTSASIGAPNGNYAVSYGPDGVAYPPSSFDHPGGSAAYASIEDLLAFGRFHLGKGPRLLSPEQIQDMHLITAPVAGTRGYGLGWGANTDHFGYSIVEHTGFMGGVSTVLRLVPEQDMVIAIVANGQTDLTWKSAGDAMAALLPDFRERLIEERSKTPEGATAIPVGSEFYGAWKGIIETHQGDRTFVLDVVSPYEAWAAIDGKSQPVRDLQLKGGRFTGTFDGDVKTDDAGRRPYSIHLDLGLEGEELKGAANTISKTVDGGGAPGKRFGNALAYFVSLIQ